MRLGWVQGDRLIAPLNWIGTPLVAVYLFSMIFYPWLAGRFSWGHVHAVWMEWQTLNVGVLAFISSMVAFNISKYHANEQRGREFIAARSFLPEALSELVSYFRSSAALLSEAWSRARDDTDECKTPLQQELPIPPGNYREVFSRCISLAEPEVANYLSYILMRLQVHDARLRDLAGSFDPQSTTLVLSANIKVHLYRLAELQALVGKIFDYARGIEEFDDAALTWEDFRNAYGTLNLWVDDYDDLEGFTKRALSRKDQN